MDDDRRRSSPSTTRTTSPCRARRHVAAERAPRRAAGGPSPGPSTGCALVEAGRAVRAGAALVLSQCACRRPAQVDGGVGADCAVATVSERQRLPATSDEALRLAGNEVRRRHGRPRDAEDGRDRAWLQVIAVRARFREARRSRRSRSRFLPSSRPASSTGARAPKGLV